jgi:hypothetical protein
MGRSIFLPLQVDFDNDEKVARLYRYGKDARALRDFLVACWRYCKAEKTNGHVPAEVVGRLAYPDAPRVGARDADRLVDVGLAERTDTGYYFGGFLNHNKSREQIEAESIAKAEAGSKGGKVSGEVRKGKAETKQSASPPRSQSTEDKGQSSEVENSLGGERPVTLTPVPDTEPSKKRSRCTRHPGGNPTDQPCDGCRADRELEDKRAARTAEQAARAAETARLNCRRCDGAHIVDAEGRPTRRKCDHSLAVVAGGSTQ